jgi:hypothetical protein
LTGHVVARRYSQVAAGLDVGDGVASGFDAAVRGVGFLRVALRVEVDVVRGNTIIVAFMTPTMA